METTLKDLFETCKEGYWLQQAKGNESSMVKDIKGFEQCGPGDLTFVPEVSMLEPVLSRKPSVICCNEKVANAIDHGQYPDLGVLVSSNMAVSHAKIKQRYKDRDFADTGFELVHPTAVIHESAKIGEGTRIGPYAVIEQGVSIGKNCVISSHVTIEHHVSIGDRTVINPSSVICYSCIVGDDCIILSNSVVGSEGMGYSQDEDFNHHRIPQTGIVRLGNRVTIGAANTIDRAAYEETVVGDGTVFDNICHTAHNVKIGKNCILLSGWLCAGSSTLGDRVIASGQSMLKDHVNVASDAILVHRAGVIRDITEKGMYAGSPSQPMKQYTRNLGAYNNLGDLAKQVKELEKKLAALEESQP